MVTKDFFLVGRSDRSRKAIDVGLPQNFSVLQNGISKEYAILSPPGIGFQNESESSLTTVEDLLACETAIGITVDGKAIKKPNGPRPLPLFGNFYEIYPDHLGNHTRLFAKYGSIIETNNLGRVNYLTNDPEITRFVFSENEYFTKRPSDANHPLYGIRDNTALFLCDTDSKAFEVSHKFIPPSMSPKAVRHYTPVLQETVRKSFNVFDSLDETGKAFNIYQYMMKMAGQVICQLVLGLDLHHFDSVDSKIHEIILLLASYLKLNKKVQSRGAWYSYLPLGDARQLKIVRGKLYSSIDQAIQNAARGGTEDLPIKSAALEAKSIVDYLVRAVDEKGKKLPHEYVLSNTIALVGAGFVTSASFLSWLIYSLVTYPGQQERLLQELVDAGANSDFDWTYDKIQALPFLDSFVKEAQRCHSPSFLSARNTKQEVILPGGYILPGDSVIIPTIPHLNNNPAHWKNPDRFEPDRWNTEEVKSRHRSLYVPFAAGPRGCIGFNVALQEVKVVLANLVYRYHFENATADPIEYDPDFLVIRPMNFYARATKRTEWPAKNESLNATAPNG